MGEGKGAGVNWLTWQFVKWKGVPMLIDLLQKVRSSVAGQKTYIVGALMILYAASGFILGQLTTDDTVRLILEGCGLCFLRAGVSK